ncbi:MAG: amidohydrolase family protein [Myxococcales bacterium]|nr:amidohydrolase family protein [Myxococcales bacterium]
MHRAVRVRRFVGFSVLWLFTIWVMVGSAACGRPGNTTEESANEPAGSEVKTEVVVSEEPSGTEITPEEQTSTPEEQVSNPEEKVSPPDGGSEVIPEQVGPDKPAGPASCQITKGSGTNMWIVGDLLTPDGVKEGWHLVVEGGKITCVAADCASKAPQGAHKLDCTNVVVSPGLINAHEHMNWSLGVPGAYSPVYDHRHEWRKGQEGKPRVPASGNNASHKAIGYGELRMVMSGATSVAGSTGSPGLLRNLDIASRREGLAGVAFYSTFPLADSDGDKLATSCNYPGTNYDTAADLQKPDAYLPHIAEGINEEASNEFRCLSGAGREDLVQAKTAIIHGIAMKASDVALVAKRGASLIWSPRSNISLYGHTALVTLYKRYGVNIALGTDWVLSGSMNVTRELQCADFLNQFHYNNTFTDRELIDMVTINAARATGVQNFVGELKVGLHADITLFAAPRQRGYRAVIDAQAEDTLLVLRGGQPLYGNKDYLEALLPNQAVDCDEIDVCGTPKRACITPASIHTEIKNLADLLAYAKTNNAYPLFYCKGDTIKDEPSCKPTRAGQFGQSDPNDRDGDGIENSKDNCPDIFNPIRPMDGGKQADADNDGVGDVCDPCPLTANSTQCQGFDPNDRDGDGVPNAQDNCPYIANKDQADRDNDGIGDVCDPCPDAKTNPGDPCPATAQTIYDIKQKKVTKGTRVKLVNVLVTGVEINTSNRVFVQMKQGDPGYNGADYSGVMLYLGDKTLTTIPTMKAGDRITLEGTTDEFSGQVQINKITTLTVTPGTEALPTPVAVKPSEVNSPSAARSVALEGVIVKIEAVETTNANPDGPSNDYNEFSVAESTNKTAEIRVDDLFFVASYTRTAGDKFSSITGTLGLTFGNYKVLPAKEADIVRQ